MSAELERLKKIEAAACEVLERHFAEERVPADLLDALADAVLVTCAGCTDATAARAVRHLPPECSWTCKHGISHGGERYCRACLAEAWGRA